MPSFITIVITSILFAIEMSSDYALLSFILGIYLGWVYAKTDSLFLSILAYLILRILVFASWNYFSVIVLIIAFITIIVLSIIYNKKNLK